MLSFLKANPTRRLEKDYAKKVQQAFEAQQNGNIRKYSELTMEAEHLRAKIEQIRSDAA